jgi:hypothetical protein
VLKTAFRVAVATSALAANSPTQAQWPNPSWRRPVIVYSGRHLDAAWSPQVGYCVDARHGTAVARGRPVMRRSVRC